MLFQPDSPRLHRPEEGSPDAAIMPYLHPTFDDFMSPEWVYGLLDSQGQPAVDINKDVWNPRNTQMLQDSFTVLGILILSRLLKKGFRRLWFRLRRFMGLNVSNFEKKLIKGRTSTLQAFYGTDDRLEFVTMSFGVYEEHVLLYGFEKYPCRLIEPYFKADDDDPREFPLIIYNYPKYKKKRRLLRTCYIRPDYS